ncbi:MAG: hypothetical protein SVP52_07545, partial [Chloroflexota bacterium]|nr:hypothetical protein [Chloroflexota bacterium]
MYQIAIGEMGYFTVIDGLSISPPFKNTVCFFEQSVEDTVTDKIEIFLKGTPAQISTAITTIETVITRSQLNDQSLYAQPQYLRFQLEAGGSYFYAQILDPHLTSNISGYKTHYTGSLILVLHYTRPNYFVGGQVEVPLSGRFGEDALGGVT